MGKLIISGAGGAGAGSDECTALKNDVLKGMRAVTADSDDEVVEGTLELTGDAADSQVLEGKSYYNSNPKNKRIGAMVNRGAMNQELNAGGSYTIPAGYHNGAGKVTVNSLAGQTSATATAAQILSGQTAWVNGNKLTGSMPSYGGTYWNNDLGIGLEADNLYSFFQIGYYAAFDSRGSLHRIPIARLRSLLGLSAGRIKKGETIAGVVGTWEGYVPGAQDLYYKGNNVAEWVRSLGDASFDAGQITMIAYSSTISSAAFNTTGRSYLNIEGLKYSESTNNQGYITLSYSTNDGASWNTLAQNSGIYNGNYTRSFDVRGYQMYARFRLKFDGLQPAIYRIWLS